ncbi:MAG: hypothetical protein WBM28_15010 [Burkholderiales bacterium]
MATIADRTEQMRKAGKADTTNADFVALLRRQGVLISDFQNVHSALLDAHPELKV